MEFEKINYEIFKVKYDIKYNQVFFYIGARLNAKNWLTVEQALKKIELNFYKIYNITAIRVIENSVFKSSKPFISGVTFFVVLNERKLNLLLNKKFDTAHQQVALMFININNKVYIHSQIKLANSINYRKNLTILCRMIKVSFKTYYLKNLFFENIVSF